MTVRIEMPQLSAEGESAALASWLVKAGDEVEAGEIVAELETDKSTVELESPVAGTLVEIVVAAGTEDIAPGTLLAEIEAGVASGDEAALPQDAAPKQPSTPITESAPATVPAARSDASAPGVSPEWPPAGTQSSIDPRGSTPLARRAAAHRGLDLSSLEGSGAGGRIVQADVLRGTGAVGGTDPSTTGAGVGRSAGSGAAEALEPAAAPPVAVKAPRESGVGFESVRLSAMRKTIARRMTESKQQVPHFYLSIRCAMDAVMESRAKLNREIAASGRETKLSVNDFIVKAAALALRDVPTANVSFAGDAMHVFDHVDISVAVATDGGLVTPVVRDADRKGLLDLAEEVKALAVRAREGSLRPEEYQDGTFTISNLGMFGIETVYAILNPPQACILGVGAAEEQPVVRDGEIGIGRIASLTLAADHRAVDGAVGAELLAAIRARLEDPLAMML